MSLLAIALGISFRFIEIDRKLYWHDEVYTSMRAAGFTRQEIDRDLFQNKIVPVRELQKYQHIKPNSTSLDTIKSLIIEDPQHPPLYFLIARQWMNWFGGSIAASRVLPALLSLLSLPLIYVLALELFRDNLALDAALNSGLNSYSIGFIAMAFLALSPFDILFAQTARQYSFLTVGIIGTSYALLRALRLGTINSWRLYGFGVAIALYTHPFFGLNLIGFGIFMLISQRAQLRAFTLATGGAIALYLPWVFVLVSNFSRTTSTTNWSNIPVGLDYLLKLWTLSFSSLFFDLDFGFNNPLTYIFRLPIVLLIGLAFYLIYRSVLIANRAKWFIYTSALVPFLLLVLPDLILGGKRSAVSRYLISCFPAVILAMAYLFTRMLDSTFEDDKPKRVTWGRRILAILLTASIVSNTVSANSQTWWSKDLSYYNAEVSNLINSLSKSLFNSLFDPLVISDLGDDFTNTGDLISLSYRLDPSVKLLLLNQVYPSLDSVKKLVKSEYTSPVFVFRPSLALFKFLKLQDPEDLISPAGQLWKFKATPDRNSSNDSGSR